MNTYVWRRWRELDQLVRHMTRANLNFSNRVADAPPRAIHVYAMVMRSEFWAHLDPLAAAYQRAGNDRGAQLGLLRRTESEGILNGLAAILERHRLDDLLSMACPDKPARLLQALNLCGDQVHPAAFYNNLVKLMLDPLLETVLLAQHDEIDEAVLHDLGEARMLSDLVMKACVSGRLPLPTARLMQNFMDAIEEIHGNKFGHVFETALARWNTNNADDHFERLLHRLPAPSLPWAGNERLKPVTSAAELKAVALRFRNCAADYRLHLVLGYRAFYVWNGPDSMALLAINRQPNGTWAMHELKGPSNTPVSKAVVEEIRTQLAEAGISTKPSVARLLRDFHRAQIHNFRGPHFVYD